MNRVLLIVPSAEDGPETHRLVALAEVLAARTDVELITILWAAGPLVSAFEAIGETVDAGAVNSWGPARLLTRARLSPGARLAKNHRLRALLAPLRDLDAVIAGGLGGLAALDWLPSPGPPTAVVIRSGDLVPPPSARIVSAVRNVDIAVAGDADADTWLTELAVPTPRRRRHALLEGSEKVPERRRIGLVGMSADEVAALLAARAVVDPGAAYLWFVDEERSWALWQGPTASPLARQVRLAPVRARAEDVVALRLLVTGEDRTQGAELAALARAFGVAIRERSVDDTVDDGRSPAALWTADVNTGSAALLADLTGRVEAPDGHQPG